MFVCVCVCWRVCVSACMCACVFSVCVSDRCVVWGSFHTEMSPNQS